MPLIGKAKLIITERFELLEKFGEKSFFVVDRLKEEFNENCKLTFKELNCQDERNWRVQTISCNYLSEKFLYSDEKNQLESIDINIVGGNKKILFEYFDNKIFKEKVPSDDFYLEYTYNVKNKIESITSYKSTNTLKSITKYIYNGNDLIIGINRYNNNAKIEYSESFKYDSNNNLILYESNGSDSKHVVKYNYNTSNLLSSFSSEYFYNGSNTATNSTNINFKYEFYSEDKIKKITKLIYNQRKTEILQKIILEFLKYDLNGNWEESIFKWSHDNNHLDDFHEIKTKRSITYYKENERKIINNFSDSQAKQNDEKQTKNDLNGEIYALIDEEAEFTGGYSCFINFLIKNFNYPQKAMINNIQGKVIVSFIVETDGSLSNINIKQGIEKDLNAEAIRIVSIMPKWKPAYKNGKAVRSNCQVPINFKIE